jgi:iron complex transport system ATP-binding protein
MGQLIVDVSGFSCGYGTKTILSGINFIIEKGDIFSIIGPNGCGKTTLLRALTRILKPQAGRILLMGKDISMMTYREIAFKTAVVTQQIESAWMSVEEYVLIGRTPYFERYQFLESERDREIAEKYMELTGAAQFRHKAMWEISGGERQLAVITRALTQEPALLFMDEPTSHLDITHQVGILDLVKKLNSECGITVVMILHDLNLASEYSSKLILIDNGKIYNQGSPEEVLTYKALEDVYRTIVIVERNPLSKKPYVLLVSEEDRKRFK